MIDPYKILENHLQEIKKKRLKKSFLIGIRLKKKKQCEQALYS